MIREALHLVVDLRRELARWREDERSRDATRRTVAFAVSFNSRDRIGSKYAAVLPVPVRRNRYVFARERIGQDGALNGCGLLVATLVERIAQVDVRDQAMERDRRRIEWNGLSFSGRYRRPCRSGCRRLGRVSPRAARAAPAAARRSVGLGFAGQLSDKLASAEGDDARTGRTAKPDGHPIARNYLDAEAAHPAAELREHFVAGIPWTRYRPPL